MGSAAVRASHRKRVRKEEGAAAVEPEEEVTVRIELLLVVVS